MAVFQKTRLITSPSPLARPLPHNKGYIYIMIASLSAGSAPYKGVRFFPRDNIYEM